MDTYCTMNHEIVPKSIDWLLPAHNVSAHHKEIINMQNMQNTQNMQNMYLGSPGGASKFRAFLPSSKSDWGCDGPEEEHKLWVKEQGACTNQGPQAQLSMKLHSLHEEASALLCEAVQGNVCVFLFSKINSIYCIFLKYLS
jgi:hypothetical protein